jgi:phenylpropionate dioxygenase-like ring-hydroxylating dioxygenase large terminal subunit
MTAPQPPRNVFNRTLHVVPGWYWLLPSRALKRGRARAVSLMGRDLAVYRTAGGEPVAMDAYCPHMGCHLALGKVEGDAVRCFFHNWAFAKDGRCLDVPSLDRPPAGVRAQTWTCCDRHGLVWVWTGICSPDHDVPEPDDLAGTRYRAALGKTFRKRCHPNVVLLNAIDEQHCQTVHHIPGHHLRMEPAVVSGQQVRFANVAPKPEGNALWRLLAKLYRGPVRYRLSYWYGSNGIVTLGPDFLPLYIMFALRQTPDGGTEGQTVVFTPERRGPLGWVADGVVLWLTRLAGNYFSTGDTKVFQSIRFDYRTPVPADRAVQAFIRHLESQPLTAWAEDGARGARQVGELV